MVNKPNSSGGYDNDTHELITLHQPPASLVALRQELMYHPDVIEKSHDAVTFEDALAKIAACLDIALDGLYDVEPLCAMLVDKLRVKRFHPNDTALLHAGLVAVELHEHDDKITLVEKPDEALQLPTDAIVVETGIKPGKNVIKDAILDTPTTDSNQQVTAHEDTAVGEPTTN